LKGEHPSAVPLLRILYEASVYTLPIA